jgi:hypothetical protein
MPPLVFISYSHDSNVHVDRVLALADQLRGQGIDVRLDQYVVHPPEGWLRWMQRQLEDASFVLFVCTPTYRRRFDGQEAPGVGQAATWEGSLAQQILYDAGTLNHRFIPILFEEGAVEDIPLVLRSATRYRLLANYDDLYRRLTGQPSTPPPPIGVIRSMPPRSRPGVPATPTPTSGQSIQNQSATIGQQVNVTGSATFGPITITQPSPTPQPIAAPAPTLEPAKIRLFTANAAYKYASLALDNELRAITDALQRARHRDRYELRISPAITFAQLIHEFDDHAPRFVHFSGHGDPTGALILKTADFADDLVPVENLRKLFAAQRVRPDLVVFATCHSRDLAAAIAPHVGHAIGFTGPLDDGAAPAFSAVLYERLAAHDPPDIVRAFRLACLATVSAGFPEVEHACLFDHTGASL